MNYSNMYNNNNNHDWNFMNYNNNNNITEPLREPVPFEDFQFSLGLDPEFAMPIPLDMPPPPPPMSDHDLFSVDPSIPTPLNHAVLDEQDHKAFSQFLDQFFVDPNMQIDSQFSMYQNNNQPPPMSLDYNQQHHSHQHQEEYNRQTHILHSLDEQKRYFNQKESEPQPHERPGAVYLQSSNTITAPYIKPVLRESSSASIKQEDEASPTSSSGGSGSGGAIRRGKPHKELLTEEEKRSNHIASEQKRRSMIRSGFKDLTEIVPTLKNINNSKSTVLFKAVDYIKYLEKRNRNLREKIKNLDVRVEVEGRMGVLGNRSLYNNNNRSRDDTHISSSNSNNQQQDNSNNPSAALLQHKTQQRQLMELQEKLQIHQKMLAQQRRMFEPRWTNDKSTVVENKMEVDTSKTTVSA